MKLPKEHVLPYLNNGTKVTPPEGAKNPTRLSTLSFGSPSIVRDVIAGRRRLVLRPLPSVNVASDCDIMDFSLVQRFLKNHFDVFSLIQRGLAVDVNTLNENPYE